MATEIELCGSRRPQIEQRINSFFEEEEWPQIPPRKIIKHIMLESWLQSLFHTVFILNLIILFICFLPFIMAYEAYERKSKFRKHYSMFSGIDSKYEAMLLLLKEHHNLERKRRRFDIKSKRKIWIGKPILIVSPGHNDVVRIWTRKPIPIVSPVHNDAVGRLGSKASKVKASPQKHANPIQYDQTSQADPGDKPVNSTSPNRTGNAPTTFDIEAGGSISTAISSSSPNQTINSAEESSDIESRTSSSPEGSQPPPLDDENDNNRVNRTPRDYNRYELENVLMVLGQITSTMAAVSANNGKSEMSSEAKCVWYSLSACIFVSLLSFFYGLFLSRYERLHKAVRVVRAIGYVATAFAIVTAIGLQLPNELMVWGTLGVCALSAPAIIGFAMRY